MNEITKRIEDPNWDTLIAHSVITTRHKRKVQTIKIASLSSGILSVMAVVISVTLISFNSIPNVGPINTQIYGIANEVYDEDVYEEESTDLLIMTSLAAR